MQPILVAYATTEGQAHKVAELIAERLRIRVHRVEGADDTAHDDDCTDWVDVEAFVDEFLGAAQFGGGKARAA